jgi:hypothetical protein
MTADHPGLDEQLRRQPFDAPALGTVLLIACPLYIVGIGVWRTIGHGALEASAAEAHLTVA